MTLHKSSSILTHIPKDVTLDSFQHTLIKLLDGIRSSILTPYLISFFLKKPQYKGIYVYGPVGRGKSIILRSFYDSIQKPKIWYHYQSFLQFIHQESHRIFLQKGVDAVETIAEHIASQYDLIVIDELEIRDIADAMIIQRINKILLAKDCFVCFSSNIKPSDLYPRGLQRELFLKFIEIVERSFLCYSLDNGVDYRFSKASYNKPVIIEGISNENKESFDELVEALVPSLGFYPRKTEIFGREVTFDKTYKEILYVTLEEVCGQSLSYNDFLNIVSIYNVVILDGLMTDSINESDKIIRFINFIDSVYENKLLMIGIFSKKVSDLYIGKKYTKEFGRALSRIEAMKSDLYVSSSKHIARI